MAITLKRKFRIYLVNRNPNRTTCNHVLLTVSFHYAMYGTTVLSQDLSRTANALGDFTGYS